MLRLPFELRELILLHLDVLEIPRCRQLCQSFSELIEGSSRIQYKIECFVSRVLDGQVAIPETRDRLDKLRSWRSLWHQGQFKLTRVLETEKSTNVALWGFPMSEISEDGYGFSMFSFASPLRGLSEYRDNVTGLDFRVSDLFPFDRFGFTIVLENSGANTIRIHLLDSDGKYYQGAACPIIAMNVQQPVVGVFCSATKHLLAVFADSDDDTVSYLWIWNWRTGVQLFSAHAMGEFTSQSVDLLDESYLLLAGPCGDDEGPGFLLVLDCDCIPIQTVFTDWGSIMTHASLILNLPTLKRGYSWLRLYLYIPPIFTPEDARSQHAIFTAAISKDSVMLWLAMTTIDDSGEERLHGLAIPAQTILSRIPERRGTSPNFYDNHPPTRSWSDWAHETRYFSEAHVKHHWQQELFRSRFISSRERPKEDGSGVESVVAYYEFDTPYALRRDLASRDEAAIASIVTQPNTPDPEYFDSPDETCIPYREVVTNVVIPEGFEVTLETEYIIVRSQDLTRLYFYSL